MTNDDKGQVIFDFLTYLNKNHQISEMNRMAYAQEIDCFLEEEQHHTFCVFLDAGHGGYDTNRNYVTAPAKQFNHSKGSFHNGGWFYEGVWNRSLLAKVTRLFDKAGINYHVVSHAWKDTPLSERVRLANKLAKDYDHAIYISLHSNAFDGVTPDVRGFEVYTSPGKTESDKLADIHYKNVSELLGHKIRMRPGLIDGDHDREARFYVLMKTHMPAILIEHLFFDNFEDACLLMDYCVVQLFAEAILITVQEWKKELV